jgi:LmeA-like phospholipid-binding
LKAGLIVEKQDMAQNEPDLGEQALSKVAEVGIASQLDEVEEINVDVRTDPGKLVRGEVDSVAISGKGLVMKQDLRAETIEVKTDKVAINPLSAVFGNIELTRPTDAEAKIVLTEADINRAFSSNYLQSKLHGLRMEVEGHPVTVDVQEATITLPGDNKFAIAADFLLREQDEVKKLSATAIPRIQENGYRISLELLSAEGQGLSGELIAAIFEQLTALLDLRNFDIPGISLRLHQLDIPEGRLVIHATTQIEQIPSA